MFKIIVDAGISDKYYKAYDACKRFAAPRGPEYLSFLKKYIVLESIQFRMRCWIPRKISIETCAAIVEDVQKDINKILWDHRPYSRNFWKEKRFVRGLEMFTYQLQVFTWDIEKLLTLFKLKNVEGYRQLFKCILDVCDKISEIAEFVWDGDRLKNVVIKYVNLDDLVTGDWKYHEHVLPEFLIELFMK